MSIWPDLAMLLLDEWIKAQAQKLHSKPRQSIQAKAYLLETCIVARAHEHPAHDVSAAHAFRPLDLHNATAHQALRHCVAHAASDV